MQHERILLQLKNSNPVSVIKWSNICFLQLPCKFLSCCLIDWKPVKRSAVISFTSDKLRDPRYLQAAMTRRFLCFVRLRRWLMTTVWYILETLLHQLKRNQCSVSYRKHWITFSWRSRRGDPGSISKKSVWDLWLKTLRWNRVPSKFFGFPLPLSAPQVLHTYLILICISYSFLTHLIILLILIFILMLISYSYSYSSRTITYLVLISYSYQTHTSLIILPTSYSYSPHNHTLLIIMLISCSSETHLFISYS
jgi:hypothetical protein